MIREYLETDFNKIEEIYNTSKSDEFSAEPFSITVIPLREDKIMLDLFRSSTVFVYETYEVLGFVGYKERFISWLFVHPSARGRGVAKKLLSFALANLNGKVTLNVVASNHAAIQLYRQFGFATEREFVGQFQGNSLAIYRLCKDGGAY